MKSIKNHSFMMFACANGKGINKASKMITESTNKGIENNEQIQEIFGRKIKPNRPMKRQMVKKGLWWNERIVRLAAKGSLNEIKKSKSYGFGREVITHASRPEGHANCHYCYSF